MQYYCYYHGIVCCLTIIARTSLSIANVIHVLCMQNGDNLQPTSSIVAFLSAVSQKHSQTVLSSSVLKATFCLLISAFAWWIKSTPQALEKPLLDLVLNATIDGSSRHISLEACKAASLLVTTRPPCPLVEPAAMVRNAY
jgi:hypothetical protein